MSSADTRAARLSRLRTGSMDVAQQAVVFLSRKVSLKRHYLNTYSRKYFLVAIARFALPCHTITEDDVNEKK